MGRHRHTPTTTRRLRVRLALAGTSLVGALVGVAASATTSPATASPTTASRTAAVHRGLGVVIAHGTDYIGQYRVTLGGRSVIVYCIDPSRRQPAHLSLSTVRRVRGLGATATRELAEVLTAHGTSGGLREAEATSQAVNYLAGNRVAVAHRAHYLAAATQRLAMAYVAEARRLRGGYHVTLRLSAAALPGQSGRGTVNVAGPASGMATTVTLAHSGNVATPATVRTNSRGAGTFTYTTTGSGQVHVAATAAGLVPVTVRASTPAAGYQRMVAAAPPVSARATAAYQGRVAGFANSYACSSECQGRPVVTLRMCAPASADASRLTYSWAGGSVTVDVAASRHRTCRAVAVTVPDGRRVTASWQYRTAHGWTAGSPAPGTFVVDCPAAPPIVVVTSYDCAAGTITAALGRMQDGAIVATRNTTAHPMVLTVSGAVTGRFPVAPGATGSARTWPFTCGDHARMTVRSGVQRRGGGWNYGHPTTVTTP